MSFEWYGMVTSDLFTEPARKARKDFEQVIKSQKWDDIFRFQNKTQT